MANFQPRGTSRKPMREVRDTRKPLYIVFVLDTSSSMYDFIYVNTEEGKTKEVRKIEELNQGLGDALNSLRRFEMSNVLYKVYYQIVELNSYGKALFPDFVPLSLQSEKICFEANGVTCLENSLTTLKMFLDPKHMPGCNRAVNVILMSDGYPTDVEGYVVSDNIYKNTIIKFKDYLKERGLRANVDLYSIGVGEDACKEMLSFFADEGKYYVVEDLESLAQKLDFVTRKSLAGLTTRAVRSPNELGEKDEKDAKDEKDENDLLNTQFTVREIDPTKCLGEFCLACVESCLLSAIKYRNSLVMIQPDICVGCGNCDNKCPVNAVVKSNENGCDELI